MGELHAKLHQNWWSGFRDIALHDTEGHSFIIIRIQHILSMLILTIVITCYTKLDALYLLHREQVLSL